MTKLDQQNILINVISALNEYLQDNVLNVEAALTLFNPDLFLLESYTNIDSSNENNIDSNISTLNSVIEALYCYLDYNIRTVEVALELYSQDLLTEYQSL